MFPGVRIGSVFLPSYGMCAAIGIAAAFTFAVRRYRAVCGKAAPMLVVLLWSAAGAFIGMHLLYGITNISQWEELTSADSFKDFLKRFSELFGGAVFYGGLIGGVAAGAASIRVQGLSSAIVTDCVAPAVPLFHAIARVGCFLAGCCYGIPFEGGITFTDSTVISANGIPRFPVQLVEAGFNLLTAILLGVLYYRTNLLSGRLFALYTSIYSAGRFALEFLRGDDYRGFLLGMSTSQLISIPIFLASLAFLIFRSDKNRIKTPNFP